MAALLLPIGAGQEESGGDGARLGVDPPRAGRLEGEAQMPEDDDTLDGPIDSPPNRPAVALYRALASMQAYCDQLQRAITARDGPSVERNASDAAYQWLVARATLRYLVSLDGDQALYVEPARRAVASASEMLSKLLRFAVRQIKRVEVRRTLAPLRLSVAISIDGLAAGPVEDQRRRVPDPQRIPDVEKAQEVASSDT